MVKKRSKLAESLYGMMLIFLIASSLVVSGANPLVVSAANLSAFAQEKEKVRVMPVSEFSTIQPRKLISCPTAGLLPRGSFDFDIRIYANGGVVTTIDVGLMRRFMIGVSFGGENIIGEGDANWNPRIEFLAKYRLINESYAFPAFALGYDSQGSGAFDDSLDRYVYKSKGFYAVMSKSYMAAEIPVSFHFGANYSLENADKDKDVSVFFGADAQVSENLGFLAEYDLATNDDGFKDKYGQGYGYLNVGIQWIFLNRLQLEFHFRNILLNRKDVSTWGREFRIVYFEMF
jgi:hypothetical protein